MNDYLVDRETLGQFVDALIAQKYAETPIENPSALRETMVKKLDDEISYAVFGSLSEEKLAEINLLLDKNEEDPAIFQKFFETSGINLQQIVANTLNSFKNKFLGGENA